MKNIHIFVDGPDGVGKTTLIKTLSKSYKYPVIKQIHAKQAFVENRIEDESKVFNTTIAQFAKYPFIVDRSFISSLVYSCVYKRSYDFTYMTAFIKKIKPVIIFLTGSNKIITNRKKIDKVIKTDKRIEILREYTEYFKELTNPNVIVIKINTDKKTIEQVANIAIKELNKLIYV